MNDRPRFPHARALVVAEELQAMLSPACERIAIVGSLRRLKPDVGDIELLFIPRKATRPDGLFDVVEVSVADEVLDTRLRDGTLVKRPNVNGVFTWGDANKHAIHVASGIPIDFFATRPANWWVSLVIRTGSKDTNLRLTTGAQSQGASLMAYGPGVRWSNGTVTEATSERHVFELCKVPYLEPQKR